MIAAVFQFIQRPRASVSPVVRSRSALAGPACCRVAALAAICLLPWCALAQQSDEPTFREAIKRLSPMSTPDGLDPVVKRVLENYYKNSFGGDENWDKIQSVRFDGILRMPQGALSFVAFKKKPGYCKIVILGAGGARLVMAYDGFDAWQLITAESDEPTAMPPAEALNFIRDADIGGHLLYPALPGKTIELVDTRRVGEDLCHELQVTLPNGQKISYIIDAISFKERQLITVNAASGEREVVTHIADRTISGIVIPFHSKMTIDGEFVHEVRLSAARVNLGVMPWMFSRPSGAYIPGAGELLPPSSDSFELEPAVEPESRAEPAPTPSLDRDASFGQPRFPELDAETTSSILEDIGKF